MEISTIENHPLFSNLIKKIGQYIDIKADRLQVTQGNKTIIMENASLGDLDLQLNNMPGMIMSKKIFIHFQLIQPNVTPLCLKEYLIKYNNPAEAHTMRNIFAFNNIGYSDSDKIHIRLIEDGILKSHDLIVSDILDKHISHFTQ